MTEPFDDRVLNEALSQEAGNAAETWQAPTLLLLGSVETLTLGANGSAVDGTFNKS
jgi:hypothetical protein